MGGLNSERILRRQLLMASHQRLGAITRDIVFQCARCEHRVALAAKMLAQTYGPAVTLAQVWRHAVCSRCGTQSPTWISVRVAEE